MIKVTSEFITQTRDDAKVAGRADVVALCDSYNELKALVKKLEAQVEAASCSYCGDNASFLGLDDDGVLICKDCRTLNKKRGR